MDKPHIYKITNKVNGKFYYGVHNGKNTKKYFGSGAFLKKAIKKHGKENFKKEILLWFDTLEEAFEYEAVIVNEKMVNNPQCYNVALGGGSGGMFNKTHSEETKQKIYKALKGRPRSEETKEKMRGNTHSEETKSKISDSLKGNTNSVGKKHTEEARLKISKAKKGRTPWNKGKKAKPMSEETRRKMSEAQKRRREKERDT